MDLRESDAKRLVIEGKTKRVFELANNLVLVVSKDRITAGDGAKSHALEGKSILSTQTNGALFAFLEAAGVPTHFVAKVKDSHPDWERSFVAKKCEMVPIEWVTRRVATGSFLKRNPNVAEGTRFAPLKQETFFKDDANHDPYWSEESIVGAHLKVGGLVIEQKHVDEMLVLSRLVFELLERVWASSDHVLVDMKIEFGVSEGTILVADVIDNDSWRLWPKGEKARMLDKQIYRDLKVVDDNALSKVKESFEIVAQRTRDLFTRVLDLPSHVAIVLGSASDLKHAERIKSALKDKFGVSDVTIDITSAHKSTEKTLKVVARLQQWPSLKAIIAIAGLSNGLGPVISGNCALPVINCPPAESGELALDIWSSMRMPSGMGCATVLGAENAALAAAMIVGNENVMVWSRVRTNQTLTAVKLIKS